MVRTSIGMDPAGRDSGSLAGPSAATGCSVRAPIRPQRRVPKAIRAEAATLASVESLRPSF